VQAPELTDDALDAAFAALADPTRRAILSRLAAGDATVNELAEPFALSLPAISKHLKVLEKSGLISRARRAQFRPCHLEPEVLDSAVGWIQRNRQIWNERFDQLDRHLRELQAPTPSTTEGPDSEGPDSEGPDSEGPDSEGPNSEGKQP
jgi:DNA-binding transcriptional ArsR family regulator